MGMRSPHDEQTKRIGMAIGASIIAAVATMLVPTAMLEAVTGATGLSELFPATAAPLGDKARALIAFAAGAVTMAIMLGVLPRNHDNSQSEVSTMATNEMKNDLPQTPLLGQIRQRLVGLKALKMPWTRNAASNDVYELSDLPILRSQDVHPDMPRRRPISAASDFGDIGLDGKSVNVADLVLQDPFVPAATAVIAAQNFNAFPAEPEIASAVTDHDLPFFDDRDTQFIPADLSEPVEFVAEIVTPDTRLEHPEPAPTAFAATTVAAVAAQPSLAELVAQFELSLENRKQQLAALESLAARISENALTVRDSDAAFVAPAQHGVASTAVTRPPLEAVPASPRQQNDDDMDAALNAALATLQRMNAK